MNAGVLRRRGLLLPARDFSDHVRTTWPSLVLAALSTILALAQPFASDALAAPPSCEALTQPPTEITWTRLGPNGDEVDWPVPRPRHAMVYDSKRNRLVMLFDVDGRVWTLNLGLSPPRWEPLESTGTPPAPRIWQAAIYDPVGDRLIMVGGEIDFNPSDTTWVLTFSDPPRWSVLDAPGDRPPPGGNAAAIYDPVRKRLLEFGGNFSSEPMSNGLWELKLDGAPVWRRIHGAGVNPPAVGGCVFVYDAKRDRFIVHGGSGNLGWSRSTYGYYPTEDNGEWVSLNVPDSETHPPPVGATGGIYDPVWDRLLIVDGKYGSTAAVWTLNFSPELKWGKLPAPDIQPLARTYLTSVYDPVLKRIIVFGGVLYNTVINDLWALTWPQPYYKVDIDIGPGPNAPHVSPNSGRELQTTILGSDCVLAAEIEISSLRLAGAATSTRHGARYEDSNHDGETDLVVRFSVADMTTIRADGTAELTGQTLDGHEIKGEGLVRAGGKRMAGPLAAAGDTPALRIDEVRVTGGELDLRFSCVANLPVRVDMFDVSGRRIWSGEQQPQLAGAQKLRLTGVEPASGVCFVRVRQGEEVVNRRVVVLR
jgi:hypothetical protein